MSSIMIYKLLVTVVFDGTYAIQLIIQYEYGDAQVFNFYYIFNVIS